MRNAHRTAGHSPHRCRGSSGQARSALLVVTAVVVVCALLVSTTVVVLRPLQFDNRLLERARHVLRLTDDLPDGAETGREVLLDRFRALDARIVDLDSGTFESGMDPYRYDVRAAVEDPALSLAIPADADSARLGRRARYATVYLAWDGDRLHRIVLPVYGMGMWSTIRGLIALEGDFNTIAGATFYEQAETPGVGDRITRQDWLERWQGRQIYDDMGVPQFAIAASSVGPGSASALHHVDGLSGATVTTDAVSAMMRFWFGPWGFSGLLEQLRANPPQPPVAES